jgi:hypothetical protein
MATDQNAMQATKVVTGKVRFSYLKVFRPEAMGDSEDKKYSVSIIIPKSDKKTLAAVKAAIDAAIEQGKSKWGGKVPKNLKLPLRDGDEERDDEAYEGAMFVNASSRTKPGLIDRFKREITDEEELYSGCYGRASINFYPFDVSGNKGIAAGLNNLMKLEDGEPLGGRQSAENDFDGFFEDPEDDDDLFD